MSNINELKPAKKGPSSLIVVLISALLVVISNVIYRSTHSYLFALGFLAVGLICVILWLKAARKSDS